MKSDTDSISLFSSNFPFKDQNVQLKGHYQQMPILIPFDLDGFCDKSGMAAFTGLSYYYNKTATCSYWVLRLSLW